MAEISSLHHPHIGFFPTLPDTHPRLIGTLVDLINTAFREGETGIFGPGYERTNSDAVTSLIRSSTLALALSDVPSASKDQDLKVYGCLSINILPNQLGSFGMLATGKEYQSQGVAKKLVAWTEDWCKDQGCERMQLDILVPRHERHAFKEWVEAWYRRSGYVFTGLADFAGAYPQLMPLLMGEMDWKRFEKEL